MTATTTTAQLEAGLPAGTWQMDPSHSSVEFSVRHLMVSKVKGRASRFGGEIHADEVPDRSYVVATIDAASIDTGDERRDEHLRSPEFLDVARHPTIEFRSTSIQAAGARWRVEGELTIRGLSAPSPLTWSTTGRAGTCGAQPAPASPPPRRSTAGTSA